VLELIEHKAAGEEFVIEPAEAPAANVVDLMEALEVSVREARAARDRHPTAKGSPAKTAKGARTRRGAARDDDSAAKGSRRRSA
jgi:DNA end-binding protein Ku